MKTNDNDRQECMKQLRLENVESAIWDLPSPALNEETIRRRESMLGPLQTCEAGASAEVEAAGSLSS